MRVISFKDSMGMCEELGYNRGGWAVMDIVVDDAIEQIERIVYDVLPRSVGFNYISAYKFKDVIEVEISLINSGVGFESMVEVVTFQRDDVVAMDRNTLYGVFYNAILHKIYRMLNKMGANKGDEER